MAGLPGPGCARIRSAGSGSSRHFSLAASRTPILLRRRLALDAAVPILFVTGNHDAAGWLGSLHDHEAVVAIDPGRTFFHVACGKTVEFAHSGLASSVTSRSLNRATTSI